jgi:NADH-quinone oxidoreductase subunit B
MLLDAFLKLHDDIQHSKLGKERQQVEADREAAALAAAPTLELKGLLR